MRVHFDVLGWLYVCGGAFAVLTGASLGVLASGTSVALAERAGPDAPTSTVWFLVVSGLIFAAVGLIMLLLGRALVRRRPRARSAALVFALPSLLVIPFGTALGIYSFWTLLNDEARRAFTRPRAPGLPDTISE
jgi:hypothetical protein